MIFIIDKIFESIPLFMNISEEAREKIYSEITEKRYNKGEYIFKSNDPAEYMYVVRTGAMKISMNLSDGREQILYIYKNGDFVGGLNLLTSDHYVYNGIALIETSVITIDKKVFDDVLMNEMSFLKEMLVESYSRIRKSEELIDRLSVINADMKVAKGILDLIKTHGSRSMKGNWIVNPNLTRSEMGSFTGLARETLTRKLAYFQDAGMIKLLPKGAIEILNIEALKELTV